jgi:hypothetical protein
MTRDDSFISLHTRQTVFYATYPYPDKSKPKTKTCDPMILQQENKKGRINEKTNQITKEKPNKTKISNWLLIFSNKWLFQNKHQKIPRSVFNQFSPKYQTKRCLNPSRQILSNKIFKCSKFSMLKQNILLQQIDIVQQTGYHQRKSCNNNEFSGIL